VWLFFYINQNRIFILFFIIRKGMIMMMIIIDTMCEKPMA